LCLPPLDLFSSKNALVQGRTCDDQNNDELEYARLIDDFINLPKNCEESTFESSGTVVIAQASGKEDQGSIP
jgi:hypothetical protein